jgi:TolB protein
MHFRLLALAVVALMLTLLRVAPSQTIENATNGDLIVHPSGLQVSAIAIPPFAPAPGTTRLQSDPFAPIIARNLEIAGWFDPLAASELILNQDRRDREADRPDFAAWNRLGADHLVRGTYTAEDETLVAEVEVWDTSIGERVIGRRHTRPDNEHRDLAHQIADEIVERVTGETGIAQSRILFITQTRAGRELALMDTDGGRARALTDDNATVMAACWGSNNAEVFFTSTREYNPDLFLMRLSDQQQWPVSRFPGLNLSPHWGAARSLVALTLSRDGNSEVYLMGRQGTDPLRLTYQRAIDSSPCWTPDGRQILFTSDRDGNRPQIWVMDANGRNQRRMTARRGYTFNDGASVSPDGRRVAFTSRVQGQFDIFVMDLDGDDDSWVRLTDNPANDEDPCWTRDSQHIVFSSDRSGLRQIHIMNSDGSNTHRLTQRGVNLSPMAEPLLER